MRSKIGFKLVAAIVIFSFVITLIITGIQLYFEYNGEINRINNYGSLINETYLNSITTSVWMYNNDQINIQLRGLVNLPDIEFVEIHSIEQNSWSAGKRTSKHFSLMEFPLLHIFKGQIIRIGLMSAVISLDRVYSELLGKALFILAANTLRIFLVATFILFIFQYMITRHLYSLLNWLKNIDIGKSFEKFNLNRNKVDPKYADELDELVSAINEMQDNLKKYLESEKRFKLLIDNLQETYFLYEYDVSEKLTYISSSAKNVLGYNEEEMKEYFAPFINRNNLNMEDTQYSAFETSYKKRKSFEIEIPHRNGGNRYLNLMETSIVNAAGEVVKIEGLAHDITERKKIETHLSQAHKMEAIGTLAGGIAHDFNNILGIIIGYSQLCIDDVADKPEIHNEINEILTAANRAKDLIKQILSFSRKTESEKIQVNIIPVIEEVIKFMRASFPATIEIKSDIELADDVILADPVKIHQVLMNLSVNSWHAMKNTGGVLTISLKNTEISREDLDHFSGLSEGLYIKLSIQDTGCGIPKQNLDRIFEPYFTTKSKEDGTGLGLAVVHAIIVEHGGSIWVYSEIDVGTTFNILLPLAVTTEEKNEHKKDIPNIIPTGDECILIVDDESSLVNLVKKMLESLGYCVMSATNPVEALEIFKKNSNLINLIITDKDMPGMTGPQLSNKIKTIKADVPVILTTGFLDQRDKEGMNDKMFEEILIKPVNMELLARTARRLLDKFKEFDIMGQQPEI